MIGYLKGVIIEKRGGEVWLLVGGVGYRVRVTRKQESSIEKQAKIQLFIHTAVREDAITLYGFAGFGELKLFELLIEVSGVGPKTAMEIVSGAKTAEIESAIRQADVAFFARIKGIGKKSAQRIIVDLKGKLGSLAELDLGDELVSEEDEVVEALVSLGFQRKDVLAIASKLEGDEAETKIRDGLRRLGRK